MGQSGSKKDKGLTGVEAQLEESRLRGLLKFKVLLLGAGECGKSTVLKQVKLVHKIGFTEVELRDFGINLRRNTVQSMQTLVEACGNVNPPIPLEGEELQKHAKNVVDFQFDSELSMIPPDIVHSIQYLWQQQPIKDVWDRRTEFWCLDSIDYYFDNVERFCEADFHPDEQDCVMSRIITTGIVTTDLMSPPVTFQMIDVGGQRNERRKWIHCFDDVTAVIYLVNLSGYASVLYEDTSVNRMTEALDVFSSTLNSDTFANTPIYLVLNKKDLLESMLRKKPLNMCFPDYTGSNDNVVEALDFITSKFRDRLTTNKDRMKSHAIAARFKRDVKVVWEDIAQDLKNMHSKDIQEATKGLAKMGLPIEQVAIQTEDSPPGEASAGAGVGVSVSGEESPATKKKEKGNGILTPRMGHKFWHKKDKKGGDSPATTPTNSLPGQPTSMVSDPAAAQTPPTAPPTHEHQKTQLPPVTTPPTTTTAATAAAVVGVADANTETKTEGKSPEPTSEVDTKAHEPNTASTSEEIEPAPTTTAQTHEETTQTETRAETTSQEKVQTVAEVETAVANDETQKGEKEAKTHESEGVNLVSSVREHSDVKAENATQTAVEGKEQFKVPAGANVSSGALSEEEYEAERLD